MRRRLICMWATPSALLVFAAFFLVAPSATAQPQQAATWPGSTGMANQELSWRGPSNLTALGRPLPFESLATDEISEHPVFGSGLIQPSSAPDLAPERQRRLVEAARSPTLAPWQREFMTRMAHGEMGAYPSRGADRHLPSVPQDNTSLDGAWVLLDAPNPPSLRFEHGAIYDPVRDRMVLFGGYDGLRRNDVWSLSLAGTPAWIELVPSGVPPSPRNGHTAIYDPIRDRMVVFGGNDGSVLNDVWALSFAGSLTWAQLTPTGTPPSPRHAHSAIYDAPRDRMVVFGGFDSFLLLRNDVRALSLAGSPAWINLSPGATPPSARRAHAAIYDPLRDRMVVFGGYDGSTPNPYRNDVWALSLAGSPAWAQLAPTGTLPSGRSDHSAIYDPARDRLVVFGGTDDGSAPFLNDVRALALAGSPAWAHLAPTGTSPSPRLGHSAIYDPVVDRMVVFGGIGADPNDVRALLWGEPVAVPIPSASLSATGITRILPNPARAQQVFEISVASGAPARSLRVFSISGRLIWNRDLSSLPAGLHRISWDGSAINESLAPASVYFIRLESSTGSVTRKLVRLH